jgi:hypothetical protein
VEADEPNPAFSLTVAGRDGAADVTLANHGDGPSRAAPAAVEGGSLAGALPSGDDPSSGGASPAPVAPGVPAESDSRPSLDESGRLVIDLVPADGTLEPVWICGRAPGAAAEP